jgi:thioesterase domain-containing protein
LNNEYNHLYCIQSDGEKVPVFGIFCEKLFRDKDIPFSRPIYDFVWPGSDGRPLKFKSVEAIAEAFYSEMTKRYPDGPYYLIGYSLGGLVAYEIASKLQQKGLSIPVLLLIDSRNPNYKPTKELVIPRFTEIVKEAHYKTKAISNRLFRSIKQRTRNQLQSAAVFLFFTFKRRLPNKLVQHMIYKEALKLISNYSPGLFNGKIHIFKSNDSIMKDEYLGWREHASDIENIILEGNHLDAVDQKKNRLTIVKELNKIISKVE